MGYEKTTQEIKELYLKDSRPWIIGLSGGKDSTCVTQLVYYMLKELDPSQRNKTIHVISNDTLVESPIIEQRIKKTISKIRKSSKEDNLPINSKVLKPALNDTFWVNLIGRGYPSPNKWFRWCTDRLKIKPTTRFIEEKVEKSGEVVVLLGARKDESASRAQTMKEYEIPEYNLRTHSKVSGAFIYAPIEDWTENDVWSYLMQVNSPWGGNNKDLVALYNKADEECPFQTDKSTEPCGSSRFGCWTCTVVDEDRSVEGLIEEGEKWMKPLLEFRNWLKEIRNDKSKREDTQKQSMKKSVFADELDLDFEAPKHRGHKILGPFTFETRHEILKRLVNLQENKLEKDMELITPEELKAIETILIYEGDEISSLADILEENVGETEEKFEEMSKIKEISEKHDVDPRLVEKLMVVENDLSSLSSRVGLYSRMEEVLDEHIVSKAKKEGKTSEG